MSHLDLITSGAFKLKKVDPTEPPRPKPVMKQEVDESQLTLQEIFTKMATIRESHVDEDDDEPEEASESTAW
jgi:uncharacterized protein YaaN involved in tellurite resistance